MGEKKMSRTANQKLKILYLARLFSEKTDENHYVTMADILAYLESNDIRAERKSIYDDIELLRVYGMDIVSFKENKNFYYYLASREFELAELKLLVDSVQSSKFITEKKSKELIRKLEGLTSNYEAKNLQRHVFVASRIKTMNESIYYNVDTINQAINRNLQIAFQYYEWSVKKELKKKENGDKQGISPWTLTWDNENYYLVAYDEADNKIKHYRVDKMRDIVLTDKKRCGRKEYQKIDPAAYHKKVFGMYGGRQENVAIEFENHLVGVVLDRFGKDIMIIPRDENHFVVHVDVEVSNMFLSWVFGLGEGARILSPDSVVEQMKSECKRILKQYE